MNLRKSAHRLKLRFERALARKHRVVGALPITDYYSMSCPSPQNALDIFRGEWTSTLPEPLSAFQAGTLDLFHDPRITWLAEELGGLTGKPVLELGPLECGHSYMLEQFGAAEVTAIEANTRAYLKCLIIKELLNLQRTRILCGDFVEYLRTDGPRFSLCVASGVLYHMLRPAELISLISARCTDNLFLWTHYHDETIVASNQALSGRFSERHVDEFRGFRHVLYRYEYAAALDWPGFCGGGAPYSHWMTRDGILECLDYFGFGSLRIGFDHPDHPNGPAFAIIARRRR